jgi:3'(2'), 5'-bisphosphate nucleotidase
MQFKLEIIDRNWIESLVALAREAGDVILSFYESENSFDIETKQDNSPVTTADLHAQALIAKQLPNIFSAPILSEEGEHSHFSERKNWDTYWLVDPLDGTKEFIARTGDFTVNIALVHQHQVIFGVVHHPVTQATYVGVVDKNNPCFGAWKYIPESIPQLIQVRSFDKLAAEPLTLVFSRRYKGQKITELVEYLNHQLATPVKVMEVGSSLKCCLIAEGLVDIYPRYSPSCEWDTAASQAVLEAAGGVMLDVSDLKPLRYNTKDSLLNPHFYALGDADFLLEKLPPRHIHKA